MATNQFSLDTSLIGGQVSVVKKALAKIGSSLDDISVATTRYNEATRKTEAVFKGVTAEGIKFNVVLDNTAKLFPTATLNVKDYTNALSEAQRKLAGIARTPGITKIVDTQSLKRQATIVRKELAKYGLSLENLTGQTEKFNIKTGNLLSKSFTGVTKEGQQFNVMLGNLHKVIPDVSTDLDSLSKTTEKFTKIFSKKEILAEETKNLTATRQAVEQEVEKERQLKSDALRKNILDRANANQQRINGELALSARLEKIQKERVTQQSRNLATERDQEAKSTQKRIDDLRRAIQERERTAVAVKKQALETIRLRVEQEKSRAVEIAQLRHAIIARDAADKLALANKRVGEAGAKAGQQILISWKSVVRLFLVQALHASIARLRLLFREAATDSLEFSKRVAEIRTIIGDATETTEDWNRALAAISQDLPFKQIQVAEAAYQALSNQVIKTTNDLGFVREAGRLALVGVSDITTAVDALTSVINAYGESTIRTSRLSAVLFKSIELGRTRLSELAANLGRVTILSSKLGVSFEEQQAVLTTLTIQGLKENVSKTLLVNVYNKLIRPSERMKELLKQWGVNSGEAAIKTFGLVGVFQKLDKAVQESNRGLEEIGEIFQRVRATIGFLGIDTEKVKTNIDKLTNAFDDFKAKAEEIQQTFGFRLQQQLADVNSLMIAVGTTVNKVALTLADRFGGLANVLKIFASGVVDLTAVLGFFFVTGKISSVLASIRALTTGMGRMSTAAAVARVSIGALKGVLITLGVIVVSELIQHFLLWETRVVENVEKVRKRFQKLNEQIIEQTEKAVNNWIDKMTKGGQTVFRSLRLVNVELTKIQDKLEVDLEGSFEILNEKLADFTQIIRDAAKSDIEALRNSVKDLTSDINASANLIKRLRKEQNDLKKSAADRAFERGNVGLTLAQQAQRFEDRAARKFANPATAIDDLEKVLDLNKQFESQLKSQATRTVGDAIRKQKELQGDSFNVTAEQRAQAIQQEFQNLQRINGTVEHRLRIIQKISEAEDEAAAQRGRQIVIEQGRINDAEAARVKEEAETKKKEAAQKRFADASRALAAFDIEAQRKVAEIRATVVARQRKGDTSPAQRETDILNVILDSLDKAESNLQISASILKKPVDLTTTAAIEKLRETLFADSENRITRLQGEATVQRISDAEVAFKRLITEQTKFEEERLKIITESELTIATEVERIRSSSIELQGLNFLSTGPQAANVSARVPRILELTRGIKKETDQLATIRAQEIQDEETINFLVEERKKKLQELFLLNSRLRNPNENLGGLTIQQSRETIEASLKAAEKIKESLEANKENINEIEKFINQQTQDLKDLGFKRDAQEDATVKNTTALEQVRDNLQKAFEATGSLDSALRTIAAERGITLNQGGTVHGPGGIDKVPAWLTAGEYVVNAASARQNLPLLQAINSSNVQRFNQGGEVRNYSFGNINVSGGSTAKQTARQIGRELKREINRGTVSL